jgi:hypothetical protein
MNLEQTRAATVLNVSMIYRQRAKNFLFALRNRR